MCNCFKEKELALRKEAANWLTVTWEDMNFEAGWKFPKYYMTKKIAARNAPTAIPYVASCYKRRGDGSLHKKKSHHLIEVPIVYCPFCGELLDDSTI